MANRGCLCRHPELVRIVFVIDESVKLNATPCGAYEELVTIKQEHMAWGWSCMDEVPVRPGRSMAL